MFGEIEFKHTPTAKNPEKINITNGWDKENIVTIDIPELAEATNGKYTRMRVHKDIAYQMAEMWKEWKKKKLLKYILSYGGSYNARLIRGSKTSLSSHAWATAIDVNMKWNGLGKVPALKGREGSVRELVEVALSDY